MNLKRLILFCAILVTTSIRAQETTTVSFVTKHKDTLYLINDDIGKMIANAWTGKLYDPQRDGKKPAIVFVSYQYIQNRYIAVTRKKTTVNKQIKK